MTQGLIIAEKKLIRHLLGGHRIPVSVEAFFSPEGRALASAIQKVRQGSPEGALDFARVVQEANLLCPSVTVDVLRDIWDSPPLGEGEVARHVEVLRGYRARVAMQDIVGTLSDLLARKGPLPYSEVKEAILGLSRELGALSKARGQSLSEAIDSYLGELANRAQHVYPSTGDTVLLDKELLRRAKGGQIILIAGSTGTGKSLFVMHLISGRLALGLPTMWFSLEMDRESCMDRLLSTRLGIPLKDFYDPMAVEDVRAKVDQYRASLVQEAPFEFFDMGSLSLIDLESFLVEFRVRYDLPSSTPVGVFIDLVTQMKEFNSISHRGLSLASQYEMAINELNRVAKDYNACLFCVAQMNRDAEKVNIRSLEDVERARPTLATIKNSHALAERARVVLGLFRPKYFIDRYVPDLPEGAVIEDVLEVQVLKQSLGRTGQKLRYLFDGDYSRITPYQIEAPLSYLEGEVDDE